MLSEILTAGEKALASFVMRFSLFDSISNSYKSKYREPVSFGIDDLREKINLSPEDQFQLAFDKIRKKEYEQAKILLGDFIKNNSENQLSGSAHYWLGELFLLEKNNREAALILAEGYQKFPKSVKAPDILYKLSEALFEINKNQEACKTLTKLIKDFPNHKLKNKSQVKQTQESCNILVE